MVAYLENIIINDNSIQISLKRIRFTSRRIVRLISVTKDTATILLILRVWF